MNETVINLVLEKLTTIDGKLDDLSGKINLSDRRMDAIARDVVELQEKEKKITARLFETEDQLVALEPVSTTLANMKKLLYGGIAAFILLQAMPWLKGFIK